jgi:hypothetical protein
MTRALPLLVLVGCFSSARIREWNENRLTSLKTRASFDLGCPQEQLAITNLTDKDEELVRFAGVEGCGNRGTYLWHASSYAWILDASSSAR